MGVGYRTHVQAYGFNWDIVTDAGIYIEVHGCHWHGCPSCGYTTTDTKERDNARIDLAHSLELDYIELWECEVKEPNWRLTL